jgi:endogenous inhibitor of DNA gyrase (YacG/DUF329 family)
MLTTCPYCRNAVVIRDEEERPFYEYRCSQCNAILTIKWTSLLTYLKLVKGGEA